MSKRFKSGFKHMTLLMAAAVGMSTYQSTDVFVIQAATLQDSAYQSSVGKTNGNITYRNNERYLQLYFGINNVPEVISGKFFESAMGKVSDKTFSELSTKETVTYGEAVKMAVQGANFEELALGYSLDKIQSKGVESKDQNAAYIACAVDTGLIGEEAISKMSETISKEEAVSLLMAVADANGKGRNFIGYTNDPDIYGKVLDAWDETALFQDEKLQTIGEKAVMNGVTTGYNLLNSNYNANFLPELTLRYGHSTTIHATQLIGLLNSEGIAAKVQLEPKTSIFEYLPEWGDVPPATPNYRVEKVNDHLMLAYSLEYNLAFEFNTVADKNKFNDLVLEYAKKNDDNPDGQGLLFASWWQPLYTSDVEMGEGYKLIYNNVITDGNYTLNPLCLAEDKEKVLEGLEAIDHSVEVDQEKIWCNDAFYRYLTGESHQ